MFCCYVNKEKRYRFDFSQLDDNQTDRPSKRLAAVASVCNVEQETQQLLAHCTAGAQWQSNAVHAQNLSRLSTQIETLVKF